MRTYSEIFQTVKEYLNGRDCALAAFILRDMPEIQGAGLSRLCNLLQSQEWGCSVNDVKGVLELLEKWLENPVPRGEDDF